MLQYLVTVARSGNKIAILRVKLIQMTSANDLLSEFKKYYKSLK